MRFQEYKTLNLPEIAEKISKYWDDNGVFGKSVELREGFPEYVFYEGPPSANGLPGIHHVMGRTIKDVFCRYKTQSGFKVKRKAGWDTHGLPVELGVEKELGITKEDIGTKISIEDYNKACKDAVMRYTDTWNDLTKKIGYWVDLQDPYVTYTSKYIESVWWLLKQIYDKGLLYKGYTIQPYSPKAGTGLSSHELNQPGCYRDVSDTTVVAQFKVVETSLPEYLKANTPLYLLAWTTTPWTLPSNTALAVNVGITYVVVKTFNQYTFEPISVVLAKPLLSKQFSGKYYVASNQAELDLYTSGASKIPYYVASECLGSALIGLRYEQLLPYALPYKNSENAFRVISGGFVTVEDGTGIVHIAPTFGADDAKAAKEATPEVPAMLVLDENGNAVPLVDLQGRFRTEMKELSGKYVKNEYYPEKEAPEKSVDVEIAIQLKAQNKAFRVEKYTHNYPHCWRTDKPILYYPLDSWFIKITAIKERMYELNKTINWKPSATGEKRFGNWLQNANDWNLSRSRFWGIPLPVWRTKDRKEEMVIGSLEMLKAEILKAVNAGIMDQDVYADFLVGDTSTANYNKIDLHKNVLDRVVLVSTSGKPMYRENDLIDVWFDSGAMPYAQWHYPFGDSTKNNKPKDFPADFIAEGIDQTRGWFYTLHAISTAVFDAVAYKNVISNGLVLDKNGSKMSKRLNNSVDPFAILNDYGPDATRWYMINNANPWDNLKFDTEGLDEVRRKFFGTLYNTYAFFALYANIDSYTYKEPDLDFEKRPEIDRWILSELNSLILKVTDAFDDFEPTKASRFISDFVQENLSNWYVRLSRRRFWKGSYNADKISAYQTLHTCLVTVAKLSAPIAPFYMDSLYRDLVLPLKNSNKLPQSVHLTDFPKPNKHHINSALETKMSYAQTICSLAFSLRKKEGIKVRQPLNRIIIPVLSETIKNDILDLKDLIMSEINVKSIDILDDGTDIIIKRIKPNYKTLGPKLGKALKSVTKAIEAMDEKDIATIERSGEIALNIDGGLHTLLLSDVEITSQDIEGLSVANYADLTVALDVTITDELKKEGIARDLINRLQNLRKDNGLEVTDRIQVYIEATDPYLKSAIETHLDHIASETLADLMSFEAQLNGVPSFEIGDTTLKISILKSNTHKL